MRTKSALLLSVFMLWLLMPGCAALNQKAVGTDLEVLKTQLARQQSQLAEQQVLLQAMMTGEQQRESNQAQRLAGIRNQLGELVQASRKERQDRASATDNTCPVVDPKATSKPCTDLTIIGQLEVIQLQPPGRKLVARVDTGANTSSLDARDIEMFESDGEDYVRFRLPREILGKDHEERFERPVNRFVRIIQAGKEDERRAVIELKFKLGSVERMAEFTLTNREHLTYRALLGRNILRDFFAVDVANKFMVSSKDASEEREVDSQDADSEGSDEEAGDEERDDGESEDSEGSDS